jgi:hypothetical protein
MTADRFFDLLPGVIRASDADMGYPLRDLLRVLAAEADLVEEDIRRMYADLFIETCEPWVLPYLGDLVGYRWLPVPEGRPRCGPADPVGVLVPRRAVADTIRNRRRKGTRSVLEDLVPSVSGWSAIICDGEEGPDCAGALAHQVTVKAWRLPSWPLTRVRPFYEGRRTNSYHLSVLGNDAPLYACTDWATDDVGGRRPRPPRRLTLEALERDLLESYGEGRNLCLYEGGTAIDSGRIRVQSLADWEPEVFGDEVALDPELGRVMFPERYDLAEITVSSCYGFPMAIGGGEYRRGASMSSGAATSLFRAGHLTRGGADLLTALRRDSRFTNYLRERLDPEVLASDPDDPVTGERLGAELNRVLQAYDLRDGDPDLDPLDDEGVQLLNTAAGGAGLIRMNRLILEAQFPDAIRRAIAVVRVRSEYNQPVIMRAVHDLQRSDRPPLHLVVELCDSGLYVEPVAVELLDHHALELRAADGCRPTVILPERRGDIDDMVIDCGTGCRVILDGLMIAGHPVRVAGDPAEVLIRHCTLVPGWELQPTCEPRRGEELSLLLTDRRARGARPRGGLDKPATDLLATCLTVDHSIVGTVIVQRDEVQAEPVQLHVRASVVDATAVDTEAIAAPNRRRAHAVATVIDSTVVGRTRLHAVALGENSIFNGAMDVSRRQVGCLRYCSVPFGSRTPRRHGCQPDLVMVAAGEAEPGPEAARVQPVFMTAQYSRPDYCRLADDCAPEIRRGADDESEMGVYHDLYESPRLANVSRALEDYLPLGWGLRLVLES